MHSRFTLSKKFSHLKTVQGTWQWPNNDQIRFEFAQQVVEKAQQKIMDDRKNSMPPPPKKPRMTKGDGETDDDDEYSCWEVICVKNLEHFENVQCVNSVRYSVSKILPDTCFTIERNELATDKFLKKKKN